MNLLPKELEAIVAKARLELPKDYEISAEPMLAVRILVRHVPSKLAAQATSSAQTPQELSQSIAQTCENLLSALVANKIDHKRIGFLRGGRVD